MRKPLFVVHSYPVYIADWRDSETRMRLTLEQRGLLWELIFYAAREGSLPTDRESLIKIAGSVPKEFDRAWTALKQCFYESEGRLHHRKVDETLSEMEAYKIKQSQNGSAGSKVRWRKDSTAIAPLSSGDSNSITSPLRSATPLPATPISEARWAIVEQPLNECSERSERVEQSVANAPIQARAARGHGAVDAPYHPTGDTGLHERLIGAFIAAGCKLSEAHVLESCRKFISFDEAEQAQIVEHAERKARVTEARYMGLPARYLDKAEWRAKGTGRTLPPPAKGLDEWQEFSEAVEARFREDGLL